jgi:hypothetical protein
MGMRACGRTLTASNGEPFLGVHLNYCDEQRTTLEQDSADAS